MHVVESTLIIEVPEAEQAVEPWRREHDPMAKRGVPAHVTLLFPFLPPPKIDRAALDAVDAVAASVGAFDFELFEIARFAGVLWLRPNPDESFRMLTRLLVKRFPTCLPYHGTIPDPTPHLTVGHADSDSLDELELRVAVDLDPRLPIACRAAEVSLFTSNSLGQWTRDARFPLRR